MIVPILWLVVFPFWYRDAGDLKCGIFLFRPFTDRSSDSDRATKYLCPEIITNCSCKPNWASFPSVLIIQTLLKWQTAVFSLLLNAAQILKLYFRLKLGW